jgi:PAS domain-containing protein
VLSRNRTMVDCNQRVCEMFGARASSSSASFQILYPSADEYERTGARIAPILNARDGTYADDRIMKRVDGRLKGETFWCHVTGRALNRDAPHEAGIWSFEDLSSRRDRSRPN